MTTPSNVLECRDLKKSFGDNAAVKGVVFHIAEGETYGLLGPNGAGKTTTISMVTGLLERDAGEVFVDGQPLSTTSVDAKREIGLFFERDEIVSQPRPTGAPAFG